MSGAGDVMLLSQMDLCRISGSMQTAASRSGVEVLGVSAEAGEHARLAREAGWRDRHRQGMGRAIIGLSAL